MTTALGATPAEPPPPAPEAGFVGQVAGLGPASRAIRARPDSISRPHRSHRMARVVIGHPPPGTAGAIRRKCRKRGGLEGATEALTSARMPALTASGSRSQCSTTSARSGSVIASSARERIVSVGKEWVTGAVATRKLLEDSGLWVAVKGFVGPRPRALPTPGRVFAPASRPPLEGQAATGLVLVMARPFPCFGPEGRRGRVALRRRSAPSPLV